MRQAPSASAHSTERNSMTSTETADAVEITVPTITHIDLRGHSRRQLGDLIDLAVEPEGFSEKWSHDYWKDQANRWTRTEQLIVRLAELDPEGAEDFKDDNFQRRAQCSECGKHFSFTREGNTLVAANECEVPGGIKPYDVLLNVPSGRIVMANDLRELTMVEGSFNVNLTKGQVALTQAYAEDGMAHICTGNTCPSVIEQNDGIVVAIGDDFYEGDPHAVRKTKHGTKHGSICTDLWWYSAMDKDLFEARCAEQGIDPKTLIEVEIKVEPGVYAFSDQLANGDDPGLVVFSRITKSDAAAPKLRERQTGPADSLAESHFWKEVERLGNMKGLFASKNHVLGDIFTVLGNGYAWHNLCLRNASGRSEDKPFRANLAPVKAPRDASYVPLLPNFESGIRGETDGLYPMDWNYSKLGKTPLDADPHWMAGGMMFLRSALARDVKTISYGDQKPEEVAQKAELLRQVMVASLDVLCEIAEKRGIDKDGTLDRIFGEIQHAWA